MNERAAVREVVAAALADAGDLVPFGDLDSLVVTGRITSIDVVNIVVALEEKFGVEVHADEFDPMRFDSVDAIVELLAEVKAR
jgi:acyl carrier protein